MELLKVATRPQAIIVELLENTCDAVEAAAELEDVANRLLDISECLLSLRREQPSLTPAG